MKAKKTKEVKEVKVKEVKEMTVEEWFYSEYPKEWVDDMYKSDKKKKK